MSEWTKTKDDDPWPANKRLLACDKNGWIVILQATENGFELDDGAEAGDWPTHWMPLPEPPK